jgi:hypothetical protein
LGGRSGRMRHGIAGQDDDIGVYRIAPKASQEATCDGDRDYPERAMITRNTGCV